MTDKKNVIPATPITPLPVPPVGMPRVPVTLFNVWTWNSPVIPQFYWNVYSAEQRIKEICKQIGKIGAYLDYAATRINEANVDMAEQINKINSDISEQIGELTNKLTEEVTRLEGLITAEAEAREAADTALRNDLTAETQAREAADTQLRTDLQAETAAREDADEQLHTELSAETTARTHADDTLHQEISTETQSRTEADTEIKASVTQETADRKAADDALGKRIDAADAANTKLTEDLAAEVKAREAGDTALQGKIETETSAREAADADLQSKITAEVTARGEAISALTTRVATEESNRQAEDGKLGARIDEANSKIQNNASAIVTETQARTAADAAINESLATKLVRDDLRASGKITLTPGEGNTVTIGDTFEADFSALQSAIDGLTSALESETSERRHDDAQLQTAVDARLERGKLLAGEGIEVQNDPDQSTVTVSAKVTETDLADVTSKVTTAQETADAAKTAAQGAQSTADQAKAAAQGAQSTADQAKAAAEAAQSTADGKLSTVSVGNGLRGDGTTSSPLSLRAGDGLMFDGNELKVKVSTTGAIRLNHDLGVYLNSGDGLTNGPGGRLEVSPATAEEIGGIKVGAGLTVTADGTLSATGQGGASGLTEVAHDGSLKGDGTSGSPMGVVVAAQGALTAGEQGLTVNTGEGLSISDNKLTAEVTQAELTAVEGKADAAQAAATQADSKAQAATEAASTAGSKADAATEAATQAGSKADAASTAASQASSKADAAQSAADDAAAAAAAKAGPLIKTFLFGDTLSSTGKNGAGELSRPDKVPVRYEPLELRIKLNDQTTMPGTSANFKSYIGERSNGRWWYHYNISEFPDQTAVSLYVIWGPVKAA